MIAQVLWTICKLEPWWAVSIVALTILGYDLFYAGLLWLRKPVRVTGLFVNTNIDGRFLAPDHHPGSLIAAREVVEQSEVYHKCP